MDDLGGKSAIFGNIHIQFHTSLANCQLWLPLRLRLPMGAFFGGLFWGNFQALKRHEKLQQSLQLPMKAAHECLQEGVYYSVWGACWGCYLSLRYFWLSWIGLETSFQLHPYLEPHQRHIIFLSSLSHHHSNRNLNLKTTLVFVNQKFTPTRIQQSGNTRRRRFMP